MEDIKDQKAALATLQKLRNDALARDMSDLAIAYGWSMIRLGQEILGREMSALDLYRLTRGERH